MTKAVILAGDVGATKTHLALYSAQGGAPVSIRDRVYPTKDYPSLEAICAEFLSGAEPPDVACFGVAGPVIEGRARPAHIAWQIDEKAISSALKVRRVRLLNDLEATAYGMLYLADSETEIIQRGRRDHGNIAVIAAGTGLGEAVLVHDGKGYWALASEGGHCDFAPRGEEQIELLRFLSREFDHVSFERVLSGPGLFNIYRFLRQSIAGAEPAWLAERLSREDPPAVVSEAALEGRDPRCVHALEIFAAIYGAEAANLVLKTVAFGGVYVAGGIAPKILPFLTAGTFIRAFRAKGSFAELLEKVDVRVCLNPAAAVNGALHGALALI